MTELEYNKSKEDVVRYEELQRAHASAFNALYNINDTLNKIRRADHIQYAIGGPMTIKLNPSYSFDLELFEDEPDYTDIEKHMLNGILNALKIEYEYALEEIKKRLNEI